MGNIEKIKDIFNQTNKIMGFWINHGEEHTENPQTSHILYYLSLTVGYLKGKEEAEIFQEEWNKIKESLKEGSDKMEWINQSHMIKSHLEQALIEESVHNPNDPRGIGIKRFYEEEFPKLYHAARQEYEDFQQKQENMVKAMQKHHEDVFNSQESWEEALRRGDPTALCD